MESPTRMRSTPAARGQTGARLVVGGHHDEGRRAVSALAGADPGALRAHSPTSWRSKAFTRGPPTAGRPLANEVVERTPDAHLDGVALHRLFASLELQQFGARRRDTSRPRADAHQRRRSLRRVRRRADRTGLAGLASEVLRGAKQLGVRVADVFVAKESRGDLREERVTNEPELDHGSVRRCSCGIAYPLRVTLHAS